MWLIDGSKWRGPGPLMALRKPEISDGLSDEMMISLDDPDRH